VLHSRVPAAPWACGTPRSCLAPLAATLRPMGASPKAKAGTPVGFPEEVPASLMAGCRGLEPLASGVTGGPHAQLTVPTVPNRSERLGQGHGVTMQSPQPTRAVPNRFAASLLQGPNAPATAGAALRVVDGGRGHLLTVRTVAGRLGVSTATVYKLVAHGDLPHVRVSNAIRVIPDDLDSFLAKQRQATSDRTGEGR